MCVSKSVCPWDETDPPTSFTEPFDSLPSGKNISAEKKTVPKNSPPSGDRLWDQILVCDGQFLLIDVARQSNDFHPSKLRWWFQDGSAAVLPKRPTASWIYGIHCLGLPYLQAHPLTIFPILTNNKQTKTCLPHVIISSPIRPNKNQSWLKQAKKFTEWSCPSKSCSTSNMLIQKKRDLEKKHEKILS